MPDNPEERIEKQKPVLEEPIIEGHPEITSTLLKLRDAKTADEMNQAVAEMHGHIANLNLPESDRNGLAAELAKLVQDWEKHPPPPQKNYHHDHHHGWSHFWRSVKHGVDKVEHKTAEGVGEGVSKIAGKKAGKFAEKAVEKSEQAEDESISFDTFDGPDES